MALLSGGWGTAEDTVIGILFLTTGVVSIVLNTLVLIYLRTQPQNSTNFLFKLMAIVDILASLFGSLVYGYFVLKPQQIPQDVSTLNGTASPLDLVQFIVFFMISYVPSCITPTATSVKYIAVRHPLWHVRNTHIIAVLILFSVIPIGMVVVSVAISSRTWVWCLKTSVITKFRTWHRVFFAICKCFMCTIQIANICMAVYIITFLLCRSRMACKSQSNSVTLQKSKTAMKKMLCFSVGSLLYLVGIIITTIARYGNHMPGATCTSNLIYVGSFFVSSSSPVPCRSIIP